MAACEARLNLPGEYHRLFGAAAPGSMRIFSTANITCRRFAVSRRTKIAKSLRSTWARTIPSIRNIRSGKGCLVDQLLGQSLADVCGLGPLLKPENIQKTVESIYKYNFKRSFAEHDNVQRTFVLNDEAALVVCDYAKTALPVFLFLTLLKFSPGWNTRRHLTCCLQGWREEGVECITAGARRYDGETAQSWDEAECGHHYARAMAAWSAVVAASGFHYNAGRLSIEPPTKLAEFRSFWATGTGWGVFTRRAGKTEVRVLSGHLPIERVGTRAVKVDVLEGRRLRCDSGTRRKRGTVSSVPAFVGDSGGWVFGGGEDHADSRGRAYFGGTRA